MFPVYGVGDAHAGARASRPHPYPSFLWLALSLRPVLKVANLSPATSTAEPKRPPAQFRVNPSGGEGQGCAGPCTGGAPALTGGSLGAARADPNFAKGSVYWCSFVFIRGSPFPFVDIFAPWWITLSTGFRQASAPPPATSGSSERETGDPDGLPGARKGSGSPRHLASCV